MDYYFIHAHVSISIFQILTPIPCIILVISTSIGNIEIEINSIDIIVVDIDIVIDISRFSLSYPSYCGYVVCFVLLLSFCRK